jgi:hypothetical protein
VLVDLAEHPEHHKHTFEGLQRCCFVYTTAGNDSGIALDMDLIEQHRRYVNLGERNGEKCDVTFGPCACGEMHFNG